MKKRIISAILSVVMLVSVLVPAVSAQSSEQPAADYTIERISNPEGAPREVDGLINDRGTSYTWRMAQRGDDIYIATYRNLLSGVISLFVPALSEQGMTEDDVWALSDLLTNGSFPRAEDTDGAYIIKYNTVTGEFSTVFTFPSYMQCRMVVNYEGDIYAGSFSSVLPRQYLYKIDENDEVTEVFTTSESFSIRANCVYDSGNGNHLYFAGADEREVLEPGDEDCVRIAVWEKDAEDDTVWNRVADYKDFYRYCADVSMKNNTGCPVWELANHNGYIYAGMPYSKGFIVFRGRPAEEGEDANEYGWIWEEVVGETNGINNPGMAETAEGQSDVNFSAIASVYEFNGELYCFDFDQTIMAALAFVQGGLYKVAGADVSLSDMVKPVYDTLNHTQSLWKLNDETGEFVRCEGFSELMEGTCNEYVWRAQEHNGYMYVSTMDSAILYHILTQMTDGYITKMSCDEIKSKITYIKNFIDLIKPLAKDMIAAKLVAALEEYKAMLESLITTKIDPEQLHAFMEQYEAVQDQLHAAIDQFNESVNEVMASIQDKVENDELSEDDVDSQMAAAAFALDIEIVIPRPHNVRRTILNAVKNYFTEKVSSAKSKLNAIKTKITDTLQSIKEQAVEAYNSIDWEGIAMYIWVSDTVKNDTWGFDLVRTKDGENFEVVTDSGFGDPYNYGSAAFLSTDNGLYIGTCNPFYGGQLYLLKDAEDERPTRTYIAGDADGDGEVTIFDITAIQRWLAGIDTEIDLAAADADGDGEVTIFDSTAIQRWLAGIATSYPIGESVTEEIVNEDVSVPH